MYKYKYLSKYVCRCVIRYVLASCMYVCVCMYEWLCMYVCMYVYTCMKTDDISNANKTFILCMYVCMHVGVHIGDPHRSLLRSMALHKTAFHALRVDRSIGMYVCMHVCMYV